MSACTNGSVLGRCKHVDCSWSRAMGKQHRWHAFSNLSPWSVALQNIACSRHLAIRNQQLICHQTHARAVGMIDRVHSITGMCYPLHAHCIHVAKPWLQHHKRCMHDPCTLARIFCMVFDQHALLIWMRAFSFARSLGLLSSQHLSLQLHLSFSVTLTCTVYQSCSHRIGSRRNVRTVNKQ